MSNKKCYVCRRITPEIVLRMAHKVWDEDPKAAREVGLEACRIIRRSYMKKPIFFCGKPARTILGGLFYLLSFKNDVRKTQREIGEALNVTSVAVRNSYKRWIAEFPEAASIYYEAQRAREERWREEEKIVLEKVKTNGGKLYPSETTFLPSLKVRNICERLFRRGVLMRCRDRFGSTYYQLRQEETN